MFTRRIVLTGLFALAAYGSTGCCCHPVRNAVYRFRQNHGCCTPSFGGGPAVGPAFAGPGPGCACGYSPDLGHPIAPPVGPAVGPPTTPLPVYTAPYPAPATMGPPSVFQSTEPPMGTIKPMSKK